MPSTVGNTISAVFVSENDNLLQKTVSLFSLTFSRSLEFNNPSTSIFSSCRLFRARDYFRRWLILFDGQFKIIPKPDGFWLIEIALHTRTVLNEMKLIFIFPSRASIFFHIRLSWDCVNRRLDVKTAFKMHKKVERAIIFNEIVLFRLP